MYTDFKDNVLFRSIRLDLQHFVVAIIVASRKLYGRQAAINNEQTLCSNPIFHWKYLLDVKFNPVKIALLHQTIDYIERANFAFRKF